MDAANLNFNIGQDGAGKYDPAAQPASSQLLVDDFALWSRMLSGAEISQIYQAGLGKAVCNPLREQATWSMIFLSPSMESSGHAQTAFFSV